MGKSRVTGSSPVLWLMFAGCTGMSLAATVVAQHVVPTPPKIVVVDYEMRKAATPPTLSDVELSGKKLFVQRCALCHDLLGQPATTTVGPWIDGEVVKARGEGPIREKIVNGSRRMPGWKYALEPATIDAVIAYLKTVTPDQKPKPAGPVTGPIE